MIHSLLCTWHLWPDLRLHSLQISVQLLVHHVHKVSHLRVGKEKGKEAKRARGLLCPKPCTTSGIVREMETHFALLTTLVGAMGQKMENVVQKDGTYVQSQSVCNPIR